MFTKRQTKRVYIFYLIEIEKKNNNLNSHDIRSQQHTCHIDCSPEQGILLLINYCIIFLHRFSTITHDGDLLKTLEMVLIKPDTVTHIISNE